MANFITRILIKKESELVENLKIWKQSDEDLILLKISDLYTDVDFIFPSILVYCVNEQHGPFEDDAGNL